MLCGRRPTTYVVDVTSSSWVINKLIGVFGHFPQDTCVESSGGSANDAVLCNDGERCSACTSAWADGCEGELKVSEFLVSRAMIKAGSWLAVSFQLAARGALEGAEGAEGAEGGGEEEYWCFHFRPEAKKGKGDGVPPMTVIDSKGAEAEGAVEL
jgi:hypothetical protein